MPRAAAQARTSPCSQCPTPVDPLRAARVAVFGDRFFYFCSAACKEAFSLHMQSARLAPARSEPPPVEVAPPREPVVREVSVREAGVPEPATRPERAPERPRSTPPGPRREAVRSLVLESPESPSRAGVLPAAAALGLLGLSIDLALGSNAPPWLAPGLSAASCGALIWATLNQPQMVWRGPALLGLLAPLGATLAALGSLLIERRAAPLTAAMAGSICLAAATSLVLLGRERRALQPRLDRLELALSERDHVPRSAGATRRSSALKPGEELLLEPGERAPVDAVIIAGRAQVEPWFESPLRLARQEGDALLAGARPLDAALRTLVRWAGVDRAWARLTLDPLRRADRHAGPARLSERLATTGALGLAVLGGSITLSSRLETAVALSSAAALAATLASLAWPELVALQLARGLHELLERGISFRSPSALDRTARTTAVVFCAEGTLLEGELTVSSIEPSANLSRQELLALLCGAYSGASSPLTVALSRCAQAEQIRPDATRSPSHFPGLGITAVASAGQSLVVGTRGLLLERRISVAGAEGRIAELQALGRSVLLAALDGRWVGLISLQDSVAVGGRAAVQSLLDAGVEPILLSAEARETCQAVARHLGIDQVRPEILPDERALEIRRLAEGAPGLAVVGRSSTDETALAAAPLSINVDHVGGPLERWDVDIASGDVRDAAWAVQHTRQLYGRTRRSLSAAALPAAAALVWLCLGLPAWVTPLAALAGSVWALHGSRILRV